MTATVVEPVWAYCGSRAVARNSTKGVRVHAVTLFAKLSGAMDSECGEIGMVPMGAWDPAMPSACPDCTRILAETTPLPAAPEPSSEAAVVRFRRRYVGRRVPACEGQLDALELSAA